MTGIKSDRVFKFGAKNFRKFAVKTFLNLAAKLLRKLTPDKEWLIFAGKKSLFVVVVVDIFQLFVF